jgi:hypothetical protein
MGGDGDMIKKPLFLRNLILLSSACECGRDVPQAVALCDSSSADQDMANPTTQEKRSV